MGDVYARVQENAEIADTRETLNLIQEITRYFCRSGECRGYLQVCKKQEIDDSSGVDRGGAVGGVKTAILDKLISIETQMQTQMSQLQLEFDDLERRTDTRYNKMDQSEATHDRQNRNRWTRMEKRFKSLENKMNQILERCGAESSV